MRSFPRTSIPMTLQDTAVESWQRLDRHASFALQAWWGAATPGWRWYAAGLTLLTLGLPLAWIPHLNAQNLIGAGATCLAVGYVLEAASVVLSPPRLHGDVLQVQDLSSALSVGMATNARADSLRKGVFQLVEAISSSELVPIVPDAYNIFLKQLAGTVSEFRKEFGSKSQIATMIRASIARDTGRPRLATLLKRCILLGLSPANVIRDPIGAARSVNLLDLAHLDVPADRKPKRPEHLVDLAEERMKAALQDTDFDSIPSLRKIAADLGVSKGFLNYRLGVLCAQYGRHRRECGKLKYLERIDRATKYLLAGPVLEYPPPRFPSHDHLAAAAAKEVCAGVRVGRLAADAALKKHLGPQAYSRYRRANGLYVPRSRAVD